MSSGKNCRRKLTWDEDDDDDSDAFVPSSLQKKPKKAVTAAKDQSENVKHVCQKCGLSFNRKGNLNRHLTKNSCNRPSGQNNNWKCRATGCTLSFNKAKDLKIHMSNIHQINIQEQTIRFKSYEEFEIWKKEEEKRTYSYFPKSRFCHDNPDVLTEQFDCQFHGSNRAHTKKEPQGKRKWKKGSVKSNTTCFASIKLTKEKDIVEINYTNEHSHPIRASNLIYQPIPKSTKETMEYQLQLGVTPRKVSYNYFR